MPTFRYEAIGSAGEAQADHIEAANADEAMDMLRTRRLFVVALNEVDEANDKAGFAELSGTAPDSLATNNNRADAERTLGGRRLGLFATAVGLVCGAVGLYGVIDSLLFGMGALRGNATIVDVDNTGDVSSDVLGFTDSGRQYRVDARGSFGVVWGPSQGLKSRVAVLYPHERPEDARLAGFVPQYAIPLIVLVLGLMFATAGLFMLTNGTAPVFLRVIFIGFFVATGLTGAVFAFLLFFRR